MMDSPKPYFVYLICKEGVQILDEPGQGSREMYVGLSDNVYDRLAEHNLGKCRSTRGYQWILLAYARCENIADARKLEKWLKLGNSRSKRLMFWHRMARKPGNEEGSRFFVNKAKKYFTFKELKRQARIRGLTQLSFKNVNYD